MKNMQISGTGNSRFMKSAISETETWEGFLSMLRAGTFPFDFNGINEAGVTEKGTPYDVDNVLKDSTAALLGGDASMVPDEAFVALKMLLDNVSGVANAASKIQTGVYSGTGNAGEGKNTSLTFSFPPKLVFIQSSAGETRYVGIYLAGQTLLGGFTIRASGTGGSIASFFCTASLSGSKLSWYDSYGSPYWQLNVSGASYRYVAFG